MATIASRAKGERLQHLRNLTRLSRDEFCKHHNFNPRTLKSWELGDYKGIPKSTAARVLLAYLKEGVQCDLEWLMEGINIAPNLEQKQQIERELEMFRFHNGNSVDLLISDNSMEPYFHAGDYVAGIKYTDQEIEKLCGSNCIIGTDDGQILLRRLEAGSKKQHYNLNCLNQNSETQNLADNKIKFAAQVLLTRREGLPATS